MPETAKVQDYMATRLITFGPEARLRDAVRTLQEYGISGAPVVDAEGNLVGMLSELDCIRAVLADGFPGADEDARVADYMSRDLDRIEAETDLTEAARIFMTLGRRRLPVVREGKLAGQISRRDILRAVEEWTREG